MSESVGGLAASVTMDDSTLDAGLNKLRSAIDSTKAQMGMLAAGLANGSVTAEEFSSGLSKAEANLKKLQGSIASLEAAQHANTQAAKEASGALAAEAAAAEAAATAERNLAATKAAEAAATAAATAAQRAHEQSLVSTLVPLGSLQVAAVKYRNSLEDIAQAQIAAQGSGMTTISPAGMRMVASGYGGSGGGAAAGVAQVSDGADRAKASMEGFGKSAQNQLDNTGRMAAMARHKLLSIGNTLDDLQYVGEMGLRPIINNIMQISPAVGMALIAFDQLRKHGDALESVAVAVGEHWLGSFDKAEGGAKSFIETIKSIRGVIGEAVKWVGELGEGWTALTKGRERAQEKLIKDFQSEGTTSDKSRGSAVAKAIDAYGPKKFIDEAIEKEKKTDATLRGGDKDTEREARARLVELYQSAKKGDPNAIKALERRTEGTGVGRSVKEAASPKGAGEIAQEKKDKEEGEERAKQEETDRQKAIDGAVSALQKQFSRGAAQGKIYTEMDVDRAVKKSGLEMAPDMMGPTLEGLNKGFNENISKRAADKGISFDEAKRDFLKDEARADKQERDKDNKPQKDLETKMRANVKEFLKDDEEMKRREETDHDLKYRYKNLVNPHAEGKSLGLDEYESSIKSQAGESPLERRMHEAVEVLKKIKDNNEKYQVIARKPR